MELETKIQKSVGPEWNESLNKHNFATYHQTSNYADYWKLTRGQPSYFVSVKKRDEIVAQLLINKTSIVQRRLENRLPNIPFTSSLFSPLKKIKVVYVWEYGPIIFDEHYRSEIFKELSKLHHNFNGPIDGSLHPFQKSAEELVKSNWKERKLATFLIDLTLSEEQLWKNIDRHSGRKAVNRANNKGVKIKLIQDSNGLKIHHKLLNEGRKIAGLPKFPFRNVEAAWKTFKDIGINGFIAWLDNIPLASTLMITYNGYINEMGFARSKLDLENLYCATDLIKWHIIQWGHKSGLRTFDLSGVDPYSTDKKIQGIFKFKKKWGGVLSDWYHYATSPN